jgi:hypothetical protein
MNVHQINLIINGEFLILLLCEENINFSIEEIETKFETGLSCHFAVDKLHSVLQSLCQVFPQNH